MIEARLAKTAEELEAVKKAMKLYGAASSLCIVGYWDKDKCIGGSYLLKEYPNELVMEFYSHCPTIIQAIGYSFSEFFKVKTQLNEKIENSNYKSLKIAKMLGFKKVYRLDGITSVSLNKEDWRYQKRYQLF